MGGCSWPQAPAVLLLDELTSFLDAGDQAAVLRAVRSAVDAGGVTAVWVRRFRRHLGPRLTGGFTRWT